MLLTLLAVAAAACHPACADPTNSARVGTLAVAAAADLRFALDELAAKFQLAHPETRVQVAYGSSGNFYSQLAQRAPYDIFFSADVAYPAKLIEAGHALAETKFTYAIGRIVLWVATNSPIDPAKLGIEALKHSSIRKIAVANPEHAPYGKAAVAALHKLGAFEAVKDKLVFGENIAQTAQFVESGAADIGIIALSLATAPAMKSKGRYWEIPAEGYPRLEQGGVIMRRAANPEAARRFRDFVLSADGKNILRAYGFFLPNE